MIAQRKLTKQECLDILDRYKNWNFGQKSISLITGKIRTVEDDIYDSRRDLILKTINRLKEYL